MSGSPNTKADLLTLSSVLRDIDRLNAGVKSLDFTAPFRTLQDSLVQLEFVSKSLHIPRFLVTTNSVEQTTKALAVWRRLQQLNVLVDTLNAAQHNLLLATSLSNFWQSTAPNNVLTSELDTAWVTLPTTMRQLQPRLRELWQVAEAIELDEFRDSTRTKSAELIVFVDEGLAKSTSPGTTFVTHASGSTTPAEDGIMESIEQRFCELSSRFSDEETDEGFEYADEFRKFVLRFTDVGLRAFTKYCIGFEGARSSIMLEGLRELGRMCDLETHDARFRVLRMCLTHPSSSVRDAAGLGLSLLGDMRAVPFLQRAIASERRPPCKLALEHSLSQLSA
jgi:hypothetical protein